MWIDDRRASRACWIDQPNFRHAGVAVVLRWPAAPNSVAGVGVTADRGAMTGGSSGKVRSEQLRIFGGVDLSDGRLRIRVGRIQRRAARLRKGEDQQQGHALVRPIHVANNESARGKVPRLELVEPSHP